MNYVTPDGLFACPRHGPQEIVVQLHKERAVCKACMSDGAEVFGVSMRGVIAASI